MMWSRHFERPFGSESELVQDNGVVGRCGVFGVCGMGKWPGKVGFGVVG